MGFQEKKAFAQYLGLPQTNVNNQELGTREPTASALSVYKKRCNVSLDWLITGEGKMFNNAETAENVYTLPQKPKTVDQKRLQAAIAGAERGLQESGVTLPLDKKAELILAAYNLIGSEVEDFDTKIDNIIRLAKIF